MTREGVAAWFRIAAYCLSIRVVSVKESTDPAVPRTWRMAGDRLGPEIPREQELS